jgi:nitrogenase molybdenum-iron protein NifN
MAGAYATIEIGHTISKELSPGQYLYDRYGVSLYKCPIPIGIENTDIFLNILSEVSKRPIPQKLKDEKGRLIDGMIDSHKSIRKEGG